MMNRTMTGLLAASMAFAAGAAWSQSTADTSVATDRVVAVAKVLVVSEPSAADEAVNSETRAETARGTKQHDASFPPSGRFVLLGMGVVLVGVLARQRRGFRRSGTILLR